LYTIKWTGLEPNEDGWSPPPDTIHWVPAQHSVSQAKFEGPGSPSALEHPVSGAGRRAARAAMSLLAELGSEPQVPQWRHWIVYVEPIGRITLPAGARHLLGTEVLVQAVSRERMLVLSGAGVGASLPIDRRGRLVLPAWFRGVTRPSGSVLVAARSAPSPTVVLAGTGLLEDLVSHVAAEAR
jgi:hypothetical protein